MTIAMLTCHRCGALMESGEALKVTPVRVGPWYVIHRPGLAPSCLRAAGTVYQATIEIYDQEAARRWDALGTPTREDLTR